MKKFLLFAIIFASITTFSRAQQVPIFTQSQINPFLLNPAYAGNSDWANAFLHTRNMWASMPDAPQQYYLTVDGALNSGKVGLGLTIHSDIEPIIKNVGALLTYRYKFRLAEHHFLSGGLSGGFIQNHLDFDKAIVTDPRELSDFNGDWSKFNFDFNIGVLYQFKDLEVGLAVKQLPNTSFKYEHTTSEKSLIYRLIRHYELSATYNWRINEDFALKPLVQLQSTEGMPIYGMFNASFSYLNKYWIGVGYKLESAYSIMAGLVLSDRLVLGYNCDITANDNRSQFGLTHEIAIGYRFIRQSKKPTQSENANRSNTSRLQELAQRQSEEIDCLKQSDEELRKRLDEIQQTQKQTVLADSRNEQQQQLFEIYARDRAFMDSLRQQYSVNVDSLSDENMKDQEYYMVLGAYYQMADAKIFQKILEREANLETRITVSSDGRYYFVYSKPVHSKAEAKAEFKRLTDIGIQKYINGNLWIYNNR